MVHQPILSTYNLHTQLIDTLDIKFCLIIHSPSASAAKALCFQAVSLPCSSIRSSSVCNFVRSVGQILIPCYPMNGCPVWVWGNPPPPYPFSTSHLLLYLLVFILRFPFPFLTCFIYFLDFPSLRFLPE